MHYAIVGLNIAVVGSIVANEVASVLRLVVDIAVGRTRSIGIEHVVIVGREVLDTLDRHTRI